MDIKTVSIGEVGIAADGEFAAVRLTANDGQMHTLFLTWALVEQLFAKLGQAAHAANPTGAPQDGQEQALLLPASFAAAGLLPEGAAQLAFRFGAMKLSVALDATHARRLQVDLAQATMSGPPTAQ